jgi:preprotein translocase subunit SecF
MTNYQIIKKRNIWLSVSSALFVIAIIALALWKLKLGIDFTGGSLLEVKFYPNRPEVAQIEKKLADLNLGSLLVQPVGDKNILLRFQNTSEEKHQEASGRLREIAQENNNQAEEIVFNSVGPSIGQELKRKSVAAIFWVFIAIVIYISIVFRKISRPVASWKYGLSALIAMFHDVIITLGVFAVLGEFYGAEINTPFVAAILTVLGYSIHDTIVVFDRVRENLPKSDLDFEGTVNMSLNQTLIRSINTSLTVIIALLAILIFGGPSIRTFALALTIGIFIGTYSSIFVASPLLVIWENFKKN